jgi:hypothetical protein
MPEKVEEMSAMWQAWADNVGVVEWRGWDDSIPARDTLGKQG